MRWHLGSSQRSHRPLAGVRGGVGKRRREQDERKRERDRMGEKVKEKRRRREKIKGEWKKGKEKGGWEGKGGCAPSFNS